MSIEISNLNLKQKEAVTSFDGPTLIFAGAGSGKTRVLTHKIAYLIREKGMYPQNILAVTFTNKAANEMKERVQELLPDTDVSQMSVGTFHSVNARILRREIHRLGYNNDFTIYDQDDSKKLIKNIITRLQLDIKQFVPKSVQTIISNSKNGMQTPDDYESGVATYKEEKIAEIFREYLTEMKKCNAVDFDDLLLLPLELFKEFPERLEYYQAKYQYVLVDEYQDTNKPQFEFIHKLSSTHRNICVVGDDDQSIYGWRGADIRNILDFEGAYGDAKVIKLEQNYRSTKTILNAAFSVVSQNINRADKKLWTDNEDGELIQVLESTDERDESENILMNIKKLFTRSEASFKDQVILYRTNAQSRIFEDRLRRNSIPYNILGGTKFYDRKEVKDVLAYLRLLVNPKDDISTLRIINFPPRGLGKSTVDKIKIVADDSSLSLFEAIQSSSISIGQKQSKSIYEFHMMMNNLKSDIEKVTAEEIAVKLINELQLKTYYQNQDTDEAIDRWDNIEELVNSIAEFSENRKKGGLREFLEEVSLLTDIDRWNKSDDAVTMMTLHSAKGLEFPVIYIAGLEEGLFPLGGDFAEPEVIEEERRLFYVGVTRAMIKVFLSYAKARRRFGGPPQNTLKSRFIDDIPANLLNVQKPKKSGFKRSNFQRSTYKPWEAPIPKSDEFVVGDIVQHKIFNRGKILLIEGSGDQAKYTIKFVGNNIKKLVAKYANLTKLDN
jgi:DNA helicase II / ATP-dependent DNA helicase PcrA